MQQQTLLKLSYNILLIIILALFFLATVPAKAAGYGCNFIKKRN